MHSATPTPVPGRALSAGAGASKARVLFVDHQDSFVHTLANYVRQAGAVVTTFRSGFPESVLDSLQPSLMLLSPGPGSPTDFKLSDTIAIALRRRIPLCG